MVRVKHVAVSLCIASALATQTALSAPLSFELRRVQAAASEAPSAAPEKEYTWLADQHKKASMYLTRLVDQHVVFSTIEEIISSSSSLYLLPFQDHGGERSAALENDIAYFFTEQGTPLPAPSSVAQDYAAYLLSLSDDSPHLLLAHIYSLYMGHMNQGKEAALTLGSQLALTSNGLDFYRYDGDLHSIRKRLRASFDTMSLTTPQRRRILISEAPAAIRWRNALLSGGEPPRSMP